MCIRVERVLTLTAIQAFNHLLQVATVDRVLIAALGMNSTVGREDYFVVSKTDIVRVCPL
jgi:hypothetical protein